MNPNLKTLVLKTSGILSKLLELWKQKKYHQVLIQHAAPSGNHLTGKSCICHHENDPNNLPMQFHMSKIHHPDSISSNGPTIQAAHLDVVSSSSAPRPIETHPQGWARTAMKITRALWCFFSHNLHLLVIIEGWLFGTASNLHFSWNRVCISTDRVSLLHSFSPQE